MILKELVFVKQPLESREDILSALVEAAGGAGRLTDADEFLAAVYGREAEISTSIGYGIAIPHGKTDAVREAFIAFMSLAKPIRWDEGSDDLVEGVFLIGVPESSADKLHLKAIAAISKKLLSDDFRRQLFAGSTREEVYELLADIGRSITE